MPIRPENRKRYPRDWKLRSRFIREYRAKNHCEWCGVENHALGYRDDDGTFHEISPMAAEVASTLDGGYCINGRKMIQIVLTVAHIFDHNPENCRFLNLAALCQRCHNKHDAPLRLQNRRKRMAEESGQQELF